MKRTTTERFAPTGELIERVIVEEEDQIVELQSVSAYQPLTWGPIWSNPNPCASCANGGICNCVCNLPSVTVTYSGPNFSGPSGCSNS